MITYSTPSRQRSLLIAGMVVGIICLALTWFSDTNGQHTRFWTNFLHNSVFFTGISVMALFFYSVCHTAWAGWHVQFKRVWEAMSMFLAVGLVLMSIIALGLIFGWHHLYHWSDSASVEADALLQQKSSFLNTAWYLVSIGIVAIWFFFAWKLRGFSIIEDTEGGVKDFKFQFKARWWSASFLPFVGFSSALVFWQWIMSVDAHWYSTLFAWYSGASLFVSMIAMTILILIYLKSNGYYQNVSSEHFHDLGKYLFAFSIFWTYLWFSQYMLIWYANIGEETVYFKLRQDQYPVLFYSNLAINFLIPFFILMRNDTKRKVGSLIVVSLIVIFGHWLDFFLMIKPGALHTAHELAGGSGHGGSMSEAHGESVGRHVGDAAAQVADGGHEVAQGAVHHASSAFEAGFTMPGFLEFGTLIGFLCLFLYVFYAQLSKANLIAKNDPYLSESLHHHV